MALPRAWRLHPVQGWLPCTQQRPVQRCKLVVRPLYRIIFLHSQPVVSQLPAIYPDQRDIRTEFKTCCGIRLLADHLRQKGALNCARALAGTAQLLYILLFFPIYSPPTDLDCLFASLSCPSLSLYISLPPPSFFTTFALSFAMFIPAKLAVLLTAALSVAAMPSHVARNSHYHREIAARVAPVAQIVARDVPVPAKRLVRKKRDGTGRCRPSGNRNVPSSTPKADPKPSSTSSGEPAATPTPEEDPKPTSTSSEEPVATPKEDLTSTSTPSQNQVGNPKENYNPTTPTPTPTPTSTPTSTPASTPNTGTGGATQTGQGARYSCGCTPGHA